MTVPSKPIHARSDAPVVLSVRNISIEYKVQRGLLQAVRGVSFEIRRGEVVALIGESGSGKTTLGLGLIRLLADTARLSTGEILYNRMDSTGRLIETIDVMKLNKRALRSFRWQECAMVFQSALNAMNPVLRVSQHFEDTARAHGVATGKDLTRRAFDYMRMVRLEPERVWSSYPHELSGGMRQRVIIALALLLEPELLILDEPTTALDILTQRNIMNVLNDLRRKLSFSMIFISHDLSLAAELADRVVTLYAGAVVEECSVYTTFNDPHHPYTIGLINAVPTLASAREDLTSIPGSPPDLIHMPTGCKFHPRCPLADQRCKTEEPPLEQISPDHRAACWHWRVAQEAKQAFEAL
jgi:peptide/nickel transport system ATP-binding protein